VPFGTDYPLLDAFWTMLWIFGFFLWIWFIVVVFGDLIRSRDLSGFAKAMWTIAIIFLPLLGVLLYLIVRGGKMHEHAAAEAQEQEAAFRDYVREAAGDGGNGSSADQLVKLSNLRDQGVLSEQEFEREKAKILN
jgi:type VI protein secretion system component VasK